MRVQFIWPNHDCPVGMNLGVAYLSGAIKAQGYDTRIIHTNDDLGYPCDLDRIESDIRAYDPDLIGISVAANYYGDMARLSEHLKRKLDKPIIWGGIHVTLRTEEVMRENPWVDFANVGEGDDSLPELVAALERGADVGQIRNIWSRRDGQLVRNGARPLKDLSAGLPWMDLEGWEFERICRLKRGWVNVMLNRGCPYRCSYCHNHAVTKRFQQDYGTKTASNKAIGYLRLRDPEDMVAELASILERYDCIDSFVFCDDTFTMNRDHAVDFLTRYRDELGKKFVCMTTVIDLDRELLGLMKEAGCDQIRFGVEAYSARIRKQVIKRNFPNRKTREVFGQCKELGIRTFAYNIMANPSETREEMIQTLQFNAELETEGIRPSLGQPYPGTTYYDIARDLGLIDEERRQRLHSYLYESTLKWSEEERLWIDKMRSLYWWWMNAHLDSEAAPTYARLVETLEALPAESWMLPETRERFSELDRSLSATFKQLGIKHYFTPFPERPDYSFLFDKDGRSIGDIPPRSTHN